jgi:hypothetical protein
VNAPLAYRFSCVPEALEVLTPAPAWVWAERLAAGGAMRRLAGAAGPTGLGTEFDHASDVLLRYGYPTSLWGGNGVELWSADWHRKYLAAMAHNRARTVRRVDRPTQHSQASEEGDLVRHPVCQAHPHRVSLGSWSRRFDGRWMVVIQTGQAQTHAVALIDGELVAGGDGHAVRPVYVALRFE